MQNANYRYNTWDPINETDIKGLSGILNTGNTCYMNSAVQAFGHNYQLTHFLFTYELDILEILKINASRIFKESSAFDPTNTTSNVPLALRLKIHSADYDPNTLTEDESNIIYNSTITVQLMKLLKGIWRKNSVIVPTSFKKIFSEARDKFFYGYEQHDAEEAYSCILQKMQEELAQEKNIMFNINKQSVRDFIVYKNKISEHIRKTTSYDEKRSLLDEYMRTKHERPMESLNIEAYREMKKYYGSNYSRVTEIFTGFLHSSINCPKPECGYSSNKFDAFLSLSLPLPSQVNSRPAPILNSRYALYNNYSNNYGTQINIQDCFKEYSKEEKLDENNLWSCEGCNCKVSAIKKLQLWKAPTILVIQLKRFGYDRSRKDNRLVHFPLEHLDISSMISQYSFDPSECYKYRLQCVINHSGGLHGGHYFSYCLDDDTKKWYKYDDERVSLISSNIIVSSTAYLLFYMREDMIDPSTMSTPVDNSTPSALSVWADYNDAISTIKSDINSNTKPTNDDNNAGEPDLSGITSLF